MGVARTAQCRQPMRSGVAMLAAGADLLAARKGLQGGCAHSIGAAVQTGRRPARSIVEEAASPPRVAPPPHAAQQRSKHSRATIAT